MAIEDPGWYDRDPGGALQGIDPDRVVYDGSVSKTLIPALRLGWLVLPEHLAAAVSEHKSLADRGAALFDQLALADMITRGDLDRHLRRTRLRYRSRRNALTHAVATAMPDSQLTGISAGLHAVLQLPATTNEQHAVSAAAQHDIALGGLRRFCYSATPPPALVLGYANITEPAITRAIDQLAHALR